jgi:hypothetical protein
MRCALVALSPAVRHLLRARLQQHQPGQLAAQHRAATELATALDLIWWHGVGP